MRVKFYSRRKINNFFLILHFVIDLQPYFQILVSNVYILSIKIHLKATIHSWSNLFSGGSLPLQLIWVFIFVHVYDMILVVFWNMLDVILDNALWSTIGAQRQQSELYRNILTFWQIVLTVRLYLCYLFSSLV